MDEYQPSSRIKGHLDRIGKVKAAKHQTHNRKLCIAENLISYLTVSAIARSWNEENDRETEEGPSLKGGVSYQGGEDIDAKFLYS